MGYTKTNWENGATPAINADNLNHMEQGIYDLDTDTYKKSEITISTTAAPSTGTPNTFYIQII